MDVKDITEFWNYNIDKKSWDVIIESGNFCISGYNKSNVKCNDIIFIYCKGGRKVGYQGIGRVCKDVIDNTDNTIKVFKDCNLNRFVVEFDILVLFEDYIPLKDIIDPMNSTVIGFRNAKSYRKKFIGGSTDLVHIAYRDKGLHIFRKLMDLSEDSDQEQDSNNDDTETHDSSLSESESQYTESQDSESQDIESQDTESQSDQNEQYTDLDEQTVAQVPILIDPCQKFRKKNSKGFTSKSLVKHLGKCIHCTVTNNNNNVGIEELLDENTPISQDAPFMPQLSAYLSLEAYDDGEESVEIGILTEEYGYDYEGCILVWYK